MPYGWYKRYTEKIIPEGFIRFLYRIKLTANVLTTLSTVCTIMAFYFFWQGEVLLAGIAAVLDWAFDYFDGRVARLSGKTSRFGSFFDFISDRLRMSWLIALALGGIITFELALLALFIEAMLQLVSSYVEFKKMRRWRWLPGNIHALTFGALFNLVELSIYIEVFAGAILFIVHVVSVGFMNIDTKKEE